MRSILNPPGFLLSLATLAAMACDVPTDTGKPSLEASERANAVPAPQASLAPPAEEPEPDPTPETIPERVAAQHVLIAYRGAKNTPPSIKRSKTAAKQLAEEVRQKATSGAKFEALVAEFSDDPESKSRLGSVGMFTPDKMVKPFSDAAFALKVNEISQVVESDFGFHVIKRNQ